MEGSDLHTCDQIHMRHEHEACLSRPDHSGWNKSETMGGKYQSDVNSPGTSYVDILQGLGTHTPWAFKVQQGFCDFKPADKCFYKTEPGVHASLGCVQYKAVMCDCGHALLECPPRANFSQCHQNWSIWLLRQVAVHIALVFRIFYLVKCCFAIHRNSMNITA